MVRHLREFLVAWLFGVSPGTVQAGSLLSFDGEGLNSEEVQGLKAFLSDAEQRLPPSIRSRLAKKGPLEVRFKEFKGPSEFVVPREPGAFEEKREKQVLGQATPLNKRILLNKVLVGQILKGPDFSLRYDWGHRNGYQQALATLLHEVIHLDDWARDEALSRSPQFAGLAGWRKGFLGLKSENVLKADNGALRQSPDDYEFASPEEGLAVNAEYFLLDPTYACRRPGLFKFFVKEYGFNPFPNKECKVNTVVPFVTDSGTFPLDIDPNRIFGIQYFRASAGKSFISRAGHTMVRLIRCAPHRQNVGPDCLKDISYHVVVGYNAMVPYGKADLLKALMGAYRTHTTILPLGAVVRIYNEEQLRNVSATDFVQSREWIEDFIYKLIEDYWGEESIYKMITENCAVGMARSYNAVVQDPKKRVEAISPKGFEEKLLKSGALRAHGLDLDQATDRGYIFPSAKLDVESDWNKLIEQGVRMPWRNLEELVNESTAERRSAAFEDVLQRRDLSDRYKTVLYLWNLESFVLERRRQTYAAASGKFVQSFCAKSMMPECQKLRDIQISRLSSLPFSLVSAPSSYGIPLKDEVSWPTKDELAKIKNLQRSMDAYIAKEGPKNLVEMKNEQDASERIVKFLEKQLAHSSILETDTELGGH